MAFSDDYKMNDFGEIFLIHLSDQVTSLLTVYYKLYYRCCSCEVFHEMVAGSECSIQWETAEWNKAFLYNILE